MKNFIRETIKMLEELEKQGGIVESANITYETKRIRLSKHDSITVPTGEFELTICGNGLKFETK